jgi:Acetoacetate decarboxylase (ADC)/Cyclic nucleotide-binding domain
VLDASDRDGHVVFVFEGEVAVMHGNSVLRVLQAPETIGLLSALDGRPRSASVKALGAVSARLASKRTLDELIAQSPEFDRRLISYLCTELRIQYEREADWSRSLSDFFLSPGAVMVPGPYVADPFEMLIFVVDDDSVRLAELLPPGFKLIPGMGGRYLLTVNFFESLRSEHPLGAGKKYRYREVSPFIPCRQGHKVGVFCPELYPDNYLAISIGRELYGFPKRFGRVEKNAHGFDLIVDEALLFRARVRERIPIDTAAFASKLTRALFPNLLGSVSGGLAGSLFDLANARAPRALWPSVPVFVRSQRPHASADHRRAIDQLSEIPFRVESFEALAELVNPVLEFTRADHFLRGRCVAAFVVRLGFRFGDAESSDVRAEPRAGWRGIFR